MIGYVIKGTFVGIDGGIDTTDVLDDMVYLSKADAEEETENKKKSGDAKYYNDFIIENIIVKEDNSHLYLGLFDNVSYEEFEVLKISGNSKEDAEEKFKNYLRKNGLHVEDGKVYVVPMFSDKIGSIK